MIILLSQQGEEERGSFIISKEGSRIPDVLLTKYLGQPQSNIVCVNTVRKLRNQWSQTRYSKMEKGNFILKTCFFLGKQVN